MPDDEVLWAAVISAERELVRAQADFYQHADDRRSVLLSALNGDPRQQGAALDFLQSLSDDGPELLDDLFELALSHRWAASAREAIASIDDRHWTLRRIRELVDQSVPTADSNDFWRMSELAVRLQDWACLENLTTVAAKSDDPDTVEMATWYVAEFGRMLTRPE